MLASEIFAKADLDLFAIFGIPVTYTPVTGFPADIQAVISSTFQTQPSGMGSHTWAQQTTVELMLSDLDAAPSIGDTITDDINTYTLAAEIENNGQIVKWVVE